VLAALLSAPLQALTWSELEAEINSVESGNAPNSAIIVRFSEMVNMMVSYTRELNQQQLEPLFCPPRGVPMHSDQLVSMVRAEARQQDAGPQVMVQDLLLDAFLGEFPCS
jgi:hypothetical protein